MTADAAKAQETDTSSGSPKPRRRRPRTPAGPALLLLVVALAGCAPTNVGGIANGDPGPYPAGYGALVASYLRSTLKDPYSVRDLAITRPARTSVWVRIQRGGDAQAWVSCVSYNAKNSFGAYVGRRSYAYYLKGGAIMSDAAGNPLISDGC